MAESGGPVIFLMGPTASGKTELAAELVQRLPLEIVSVDSAMVYRGMDIGTAKPGRELLAKAPHRLIDICDPAESYSAARFRTDALREIGSIRRSGRIPLLTGGTGLYFRSLERGLSALPSADPAIRARLAGEGSELGWARLHKRLAQVDPDSAGRIHPNDPQRIQRALEVYELSGTPMSRLLAGGRSGALDVPPLKLVIAPAQRADSRRRAEERFRHMLRNGLLDEARGLYGRGDLNAAMPSMRLVGYRQIWQFLAGAIDEKEMFRRAVVATQQLAKRQMTWFRSEGAATWLSGTCQQLVDKVLKILALDPNFQGKL
jgi:tRNA dimethylallyltransferase